MQGEFIVERLLPKIAREICEKRGITLRAYSDDWVLRLEKVDKVKWIVGYVLDINSSGAVHISSDKVACYQVLAAENISCFEHYLARSRAFEKFLSRNLASLDKNAPVVAKPLSSSSGLGVMPCNDIDAAKVYIMSQPTGDWTVSPRYDIIREVRYFMLDGTALLVYEKTKPSDNHGLPMFNLGQGAIAQMIQSEEGLTSLAAIAQNTIGLRLCAVDIAELADGTHKIVEVNSGFMMEHFARQSDEYYTLAYSMYEKIIDAMMEK